MKILAAVTLILIINALIFAYFRLRYMAECNKFRLTLKAGIAASYRDDEGFIRCTITEVRGDEVKVRTRSGNVLKVTRDQVYPPIR